jgi:hypothetical protein
MVSAFYPGRARCLEQALVLWTVLRLERVQADLRLGVKPSKGVAHAWVEMDGEPIGEVRERTDLFIAIPLSTVALDAAR